MVGMLLAALYATAIVVFSTSPLLVDERFHYAQESFFYHGKWELVPELTTIPGYHLLLAGLAHVTGTNTLVVVRIIHALISLSAVGGFYALRRCLWPGTVKIGTAQFLCLPLLTPLFFAVYTDMPAVSLLLWATWAAVSGRVIVSTLFLCLLVLVRQHEVLWAFFLMMLVVRPARGWPELNRELSTKIIAMAPLTLPIALFLAYWWWNGSISLSKSQTTVHPDLSFHTANVMIGVLVIGLLLPLQAITSINGQARTFTDRPWIILVPILGFVTFWFGLDIDHPYNGATKAYLHLLTPTRLISSLLVAAALSYVLVTRLRPIGAGMPLAIVSVAFLSASWLVEPRYLIAPLSLWLAMRQHQDAWIEWVTVAYWLAFAALMMVAALSVNFIV